MELYESCTKEQLISQIKSLKAHNLQLQNIIAKSQVKEKEKYKIQKPFDFKKCKYRHVLLKFFYLGWDYHGYVVQEDTANTIEHYIFEALTKTCLIESRRTANYHRCGRTDKGVSSFSQVISLDIRSRSEDIENEFNYCKILNNVLPSDIQIIAWCSVAKNFSARFDCKSRTYKYFFPKADLDIEVMKLGTKHLEGTHDFRNFCKMDVNNGVTAFTRTILSTEIKPFLQNASDYGIYILTIHGNAFLWHQIRYIVGILLLIGQHKEKPEIILELLDVTKNPRKPNYHMASEVPLNLYDCSYDNIKWNYDREVLDKVANKLYHRWTFSAVKCAMMQSMLLDLTKQTEMGADHFTSDCLIPGKKQRSYTPLMKRQLCDSLEDKLRCLKKQKKER